MAPPRLAFVGDPQRFSAWAGEVLDPWTSGARARLEALRPDVVVAFDVDALAPEAYAVGVPVLGVAAPDLGGYDAKPSAPRAAPKAPLKVRAEARALALAGRVTPKVQARAEWRAEQLVPPEPAYDRLVALDHVAAAGRPLWRLLTPPVADALFADARKLHHAPRVTVLAPSTAYRERLLTTAKHEHDIVHIAHGATAGALRDIDVALAVRAHPAGFAHGVAVHLAAGHLVICDEQDPWHGIEPGTDVVLAEDDRKLSAAVRAVKSAPDVHYRVRVRGRMKAERFRASRVWRLLAEDLLADLEAFGR
jgi:hypothetical protein